MELDTTTSTLIPSEPQDIRVAGDRLIRRLDEYSDEDRELIMWLYHYSRENDLSYADVAKRLTKGKEGATYSPNSVQQLLTGNRDATQIRAILTAIADFKEIVLAEQASRRAPFIETNLSDRIHKYCEAAVAQKRIGMIIGDSQIGKTEALLEFQRRNNHGRTIYVRVGVRGTLSDFVNALAVQCGLSNQLAIGRAKQRILGYIRANNLLIVDEVHACFTPTERPNSYDIIEFVREIFDETKCSVILSATNVLKRMLEKDGIHKKVATQLRRRSLPTQILESVPLRKDLAKFAAHYDLSPATGEALATQSEIVRADGLGMWLTILAAADRNAKKAKKTLTWDHVLKTHAAFLKLSVPPTEEDAQ